MLTMRVGMRVAIADNWTRIFSCGEGKIKLDFSQREILDMAQIATRIKICSAKDATECVISKPNKNPIVMLRQLSAVSHINGQPCDRACVKRNWDGPRRSGLWSSCPVPQRGNILSPSTENLFFHSCGNGDGLHVSAGSDGQAYHCGWTAQGDDGLEVSIDADALASTDSDRCQAIKEKIELFDVQEMWSTHQVDSIAEAWAHLAAEQPTECLSLLLRKIAASSSPTTASAPSPPPQDPLAMGSKARPAQSCDELTKTSAKSGVFWVRPYDSSAQEPVQVYCDLGPSHAGGGWTLLLKTYNGGTAFSHDSPHWSSASTLNPDSLSLQMDKEAKFDAFNKMSMREFMLVMPGPESPIVWRTGPILETTGAVEAVHAFTLSTRVYVFVSWLPCQLATIAEKRLNIVIGSQP